MVLKESRQIESLTIWESSVEHYAWNWLLVEAEAACVRQNASPDVWRDLRHFTSYFGFTELDTGDLQQLLTFNRVIGLRSADAAHLYCFERISQTVDEIHLATFDQEMLAAARKLALPIHPLCLEL